MIHLFSYQSRNQHQVRICEGGRPFGNERLLVSGFGDSLETDRLAGMPVAVGTRVTPRPPHRPRRASTLPMSRMLPPAGKPPRRTLRQVAAASQEEQPETARCLIGPPSAFGLSRRRCVFDPVLCGKAARTLAAAFKGIEQAPALVRGEPQPPDLIRPDQSRIQRCRISATYHPTHPRIYRWRYGPRLHLEDVLTRLPSMMESEATTLIPANWLRARQGKPLLSAA